MFENGMLNYLRFGLVRPQRYWVGVDSSMLTSIPALGDSGAPESGHQAARL